MGTLTHGYYKPDDGDKGKVLFGHLEDNIQLVNDHNHDGITGLKVLSTNIQNLSQVALSANWVSQPNGLYRQLISTTGGIDYTNHAVFFRDDANQDPLELTTEFVALAQFYVYINDNTKDVKILYT